MLPRFFQPALWGWSSLVGLRCYSHSTLTQLEAFVVVLFVALMLLPPQIFAQNLGVAEYITIDNASTIPTGSIVIHSQGQYSLSNEAYSKDLFGIITRNPALALIPDDITLESAVNQAPLVKSGVVQVRVNGSGGAITSGNLITSSETPGVGMRAQKSGFVLGVAQANFSPTSPEEETTLPVLLDTKFAFADDAPTSSRVVQRLMSVVSLNTLSIIEEPVTSFKYTAAAFAVLISLAMAAATFGRVAYAGVTALGRNPLAKNSILLGIIINSLLAVCIASAGPIAAYFILNW